MERQHIYVDAVTFQYRCYNQDERGRRHTGQVLARVEYTKFSPFIRQLAGEQGISTPIEPDTLLALVERIKADSLRVYQGMLDPDPFEGQHQAEAQKEGEGT